MKEKSTFPYLQSQECQKRVQISATKIILGQKSILLPTIIQKFCAEATNKHAYQQADQIQSII